MSIPRFLSFPETKKILYYCKAGFYYGYYFFYFFVVELDFFNYDKLLKKENSFLGRGWTTTGKTPAAVKLLSAH